MGKDREEVDEAIADLVNSLMEELFGELEESPIYESIEDYEDKTGKRFRMKKDEKEEGLTREEAFERRFKSE
jgi:hypothetical protein